MSQVEPVAILLLHKGEPIDVLGYAPKGRTGHLWKALKANAGKIAAICPSLTERGNLVEQVKGALVFGEFAICFSTARIAPPRRPETPPKSSTERARAHRRRKKYGLVEVSVEVPEGCADEIRRLADEMALRRKAEVDVGR